MLTTMCESLYGNFIAFLGNLKTPSRSDVYCVRKQI